jgi:hypothetical protein
MVLAMTSWRPAAFSANGAVSRDEPHPFDSPETTTPNPPFRTSSFFTAPSRIPT